MAKMDWGQVKLNGGPPCFAVLPDEPDKYCGRAQRWKGHGIDHEYISLEVTCPNCGSENVEVETEHEEGKQIFCFECGYGEEA